MPKVENPTVVRPSVLKNVAADTSTDSPSRNHILTKKPTKRKRHLRGMKTIAAADTPLIKADVRRLSVGSIALHLAERTTLFLRDESCQELSVE